MQKQYESVVSACYPLARMAHGPLPARPAGEAVLWLTQRANCFTCRTSQDKPAGVGSMLAAELLHLPDKPAGGPTACAPSGLGSILFSAIFSAHRLWGLLEV